MHVEIKIVGSTQKFSYKKLVACEHKKTASKFKLNIFQDHAILDPGNRMQ
jgi:hypothetical protein